MPDDEAQLSNEARWARLWDAFTSPGPLHLSPHEFDQIFPHGDQPVDGPALKDMDDFMDSILEYGNPFTQSEDPLEGTDAYIEEDEVWDSSAYIEWLRVSDEHVPVIKLNFLRLLHRLIVGSARSEADRILANAHATAARMKEEAISYAQAVRDRADRDAERILEEAFGYRKKALADYELTQSMTLTNQLASLKELSRVSSWVNELVRVGASACDAQIARGQTRVSLEAAMLQLRVTGLGGFQGVRGRSSSNVFFRTWSYNREFPPIGNIISQPKVHGLCSLEGHVDQLQLEIRNRSAFYLRFSGVASLARWRQSRRLLNRLAQIDELKQCMTVLENACLVLAADCEPRRILQLTDHDETSDDFCRDRVATAATPEAPEFGAQELQPKTFDLV